jgi:hypothetical protein
MWNPKMVPYIYGTCAGMHIIDLDSTKLLLERALLVTRYNSGFCGAGGPARAPHHLWRAETLLSATASSSL